MRSDRLLQPDRPGIKEAIPMGETKEERISWLEECAKGKGVHDADTFQRYLLEMQLEKNAERFTKTSLECAEWLKTAEIELAGMGDYAIAKLTHVGKAPITQPAYLGMYLEDPTKFCLIVGAQGSGKTQLAIQQTFLSSHRFGIPGIVASPKKDFTALIPYLGDQALYCEWRAFGINPIIHGSAGASGQRAYISECCEILCEVGVISGKSVAQRGLESAVEKGITNWPDFVTYFLSTPASLLGAKSEWKKNLDSVFSNIDANMGRVLASRDNTLMEHVLEEKKLLIINTDGLSNYERMFLNFIVNWLVQRLKHDQEE